MIFFRWEWTDKDEFPCPVHAHSTVEINGLGPLKWSTFTKLLQKLPTSDDFDLAGRVHDILYSMIPIGLIRIRYGGKWRTVAGKDDADHLFREMMLDVANSKPWYNRPIFRHAARRNYLCVKFGGDDSVKHEHKKTSIKRSEIGLNHLS